MTSAPAPRRRRRRRVADENRKRAPRACDRCKARKSKCIESVSGSCQRCSSSNLTCRFEREKSPRDVGQIQASPQSGVRSAPSDTVRSPEENIAIDSHQTERILWPRFLSKLREAFSLDPHTAPEERDMVAMQAHIARPSILVPAELSRLRTAISCFPPKPVADFLLSVCTKHALDIFFYFDQAQLLSEFDQFYTDPNSPLRSDSTFICLAMAALALGSQWTLLERPESLPPGSAHEEGDPGRLFYGQAKTLMADIIDRPCIRAIQAPFILGVYLMPASAIGSSYVFMGLALRKAIALDLHRNTDDQVLDEREREIRRRVWWTIYSLERCTTIKLNRPRSISADIINVPLPSPMPLLDGEQKFDNVQHQIAYAKLIRILDRVAEPGDWLTDATKPTRSANAEADLRQWKKALPQEFKLENIHPRDSSYRAVFHLYLNYYYAWIAIGKVSLVTVARTKLRHHLGRESQQPRVDETVEQLSRACAKAARKLLQLFEKLTSTRNITRFSFTDFQGCSIATIVTLVAGILERDSAYEASVAFGLDCLRKMAAGNMTAKMGVRFVEALQSITKEAIEKLNQASHLAASSASGEATSADVYNQWAEWLQKQDGMHRGDQETTTESVPTDSATTGPQSELWSMTHHNGTEGTPWGALERGISVPMSFVPEIGHEGTSFPRNMSAAEHEFSSGLYNDEQTFLMGLTGLDVLDFSEFSNQLV